MKKIGKISYILAVVLALPLMTLGCSLFDSEGPSIYDYCEGYNSGVGSFLIERIEELYNDTYLKIDTIDAIDEIDLDKDYTCEVNTDSMYCSAVANVQQLSEKEKVINVKTVSEFVGGDRSTTYTTIFVTYSSINDISQLVSINLREYYHADEEYYGYNYIQSSHDFRNYDHSTIEISIWFSYNQHLELEEIQELLANSDSIKGSMWCEFVSATYNAIPAKYTPGSDNKFYIRNINGFCYHHDEIPTNLVETMLKQYRSTSFYTANEQSVELDPSIINIKSRTVLVGGTDAISVDDATQEETTFSLVF